MNTNLSDKQIAQEQKEKQMAETILEMAHKNYKKSLNNSNQSEIKNEINKDQDKKSSIKNETFQDKMKLFFFKKQS